MYLRDESRLRKILGGLAALGFLAAVAVHILTYLHPEEFQHQVSPNLIITLHILCYLVFTALGFSLHSRVFNQKVGLRNIATIFPRRARFIIRAAFFYALICAATGVSGRGISAIWIWCFMTSAVFFLSPVNVDGHMPRRIGHA